MNQTTWNPSHWDIFKDPCRKRRSYQGPMAQRFEHKRSDEIYYGRIKATNAALPVHGSKPSSGVLSRRAGVTAFLACSVVMALVLLS